MSKAQVLFWFSIDSPQVSIKQINEGNNRQLNDMTVLQVVQEAHLIVGNPLLLIRNILFHTWHSYREQHLSNWGKYGIIKTCPLFIKNDVFTLTKI